MKAYRVSLSRTHLPAPGRGQMRHQLQYTWAEFDDNAGEWNEFPKLPPLLRVGDTLRFFVDDPDQSLGNPSLDVHFQKQSPLGQRVSWPQNGTFVPGMGWFWPGESGFPIAPQHTGVEDLMEIGFTVALTATLADGESRTWFVDPEMNVEPPHPPPHPPHGGRGTAGYGPKPGRRA